MLKKSVTIPLQYDTDFSPFLAHEFDTALKWLEQNKFDGIEVCVAEPKKVDINLLKKKLQAHRLSVSTISTGQAKNLEEICLTHEDEGKRAKAIERIKEHIDLAVQIGCPNITIGLLRGVGSREKKVEQIALLKKGLERCLEYAELYNVRLLFEPINRYETNLINSCEEAWELMKEFDFNSKLGILYDTFHSNIEDADMLEALYKYGCRIYHVHLADSNRCLPGKGHIDFKKIINYLYEIKYAGFVSIEVLNVPDRKTVISEMRQSLENIM